MDAMSDVDVVPMFCPKIMGMAPVSYTHLCLGISPVHIRRAAVDPHCQPQTKAFPRHDAQTLCHGLHLSVRPRTQQQNLPRCIPQNDTCLLYTSRCV